MNSVESTEFVKYSHKNISLEVTTTCLSDRGDTTVPRDTIVP